MKNIEFPRRGNRSFIVTDTQTGKSIVSEA